MKNLARFRRENKIKKTEESGGGGRTIFLFLIRSIVFQQKAEENQEGFYGNTPLLRGIISGSSGIRK